MMDDKAYEEFKEYLDYVVDAAFRKGVYWYASGTVPIGEAIEKAQKQILECKE